MQQSARIFFIDYTVTFKNLFNTRLLTKDKNKKTTQKTECSIWMSVFDKDLFGMV